MSRDFCHKKCMGRGQPRDCAMKKWRLFERGQRWFLRVEWRTGLSEAFLRLFEHGGTKLVHMREAADAAVFYLLFLLFSAVVVGVSCFQL